MSKIKSINYNENIEKIENTDFKLKNKTKVKFDPEKAFWAIDSFLENAWPLIFMAVIIYFGIHITLLLLKSAVGVL